MIIFHSGSFCILGSSFKCCLMFGKPVQNKSSNVWFFFFGGGGEFDMKFRTSYHFPSHTKAFGSFLLLLLEVPDLAAGVKQGGPQMDLFESNAGDTKTCSALRAF